MYAKVYSRFNQGIQSKLVSIEIQIQKGLPQFNLVALSAFKSKQIKDKIVSILGASGFEIPNGIITVNFYPNIKIQHTAKYDLAICIGLLLASKQIHIDHVDQMVFCSEINLKGQLLSTDFCLNDLIANTQEKHISIISNQDAKDYAFLTQGNIIGAESLSAMIQKLIQSTPKQFFHIPQTPLTPARPNPEIQFEDIKGNEIAKQAMQIAAAGGHHLLLSGCQGLGKSMLAKAYQGILPALNPQAQLESIAIHHIEGNKQSLDNLLSGQRPVRTPHCKISQAALLGGGTKATPGEISLAHQGLLFLDELPEFNRQCLEALRTPMETGTIQIKRHHYDVSFPAQFQLLAAMNPCRCANPDKNPYQCKSTSECQIKYQHKISAALLDRIDMHVKLSDYEYQPQSKYNSKTMRLNVQKAYDLQIKRQGKPNQQLTEQAMKSHCILDKKTKAFFIRACKTLNLSLRSHDKIIKVARTIADLEHQTNITQQHLQESLSLRQIT